MKPGTATGWSSVYRGRRASLGRGFSKNVCCRLGFDEGKCSMRKLHLACSLLTAMALSLGAVGCAEQAPSGGGSAKPAAPAGGGSSLGGGAEVPAAAEEKPATEEKPAAAEEKKEDAAPAEEKKE